MTPTDPPVPAGTPIASTPPEPPAPPAPPGDHATRDQLRAMAHPLRMQIAERVGRRGSARAADIAADLGIPANSVSYHLRFLARGGVIEEAPDAARDRRDRVWRLAQQSFSPVSEGVTPDGSSVDRDYLEASSATTLAALDWIRAGWVTEAAQRSARFPETREDRAPMMLFSNSLRLTRDEADALFAEIRPILARHAALHRDATGADLPEAADDPDHTLTFRMLFALIGERPTTP